VVALAGLQPEGQAYNYLGCRWPDEPTGRTTLRYSGDGSADVWRTAGQRWGAAPSNVSFADDSVAHVFTASSADYGNVGFDGFIQYTCVAGFFVPRQVHVGLNTFYTKAYPAGMRLAVAGHELGHAAGLAHHDEAACKHRPLMHSTSARWVECGIDRPTADDSAGTRGLYP
jgi:hypothetical protein